MDHQDIVEMARSVDGDLASRIDFMLEIDKLKTVLRRSRIVDGSRYENTAEHSWHLALAALVLAPHADNNVDVTRAMEILLIHDLVEIDAGDTYVYDEQARWSKERLERAAAERIFKLLPADQAAHIAELWDEYEKRTTATARFAYAIDRLQPLLLNGASGGTSWLENGIRYSQAAAINSPIANGSTTLWQLADAILSASAGEGILADDRTDDRADDRATNRTESA